MSAVDQSKPVHIGDVQESTIIDAARVLKHSFNDNASDLSLTNIFNNRQHEIIKDISSITSTKSMRSPPHLVSKEPDTGSAYEPDDEQPVLFTEQVTPSLVKEQLQSLASQIEQIKQAKQEMVRVIKSQKAQKQMLNLQDSSEEEEFKSAPASYLNELVLRPILDHTLKTDMLISANEQQKESATMSFDDVVDKYKLSKLKEDALTQLDDRALFALSV